VDYSCHPGRRLRHWDQIGQIGGDVMIWSTHEPRERPTSPGWTNRCVVPANRPDPSGTGHRADAAPGNAAPRRRRPQPRRRDKRVRRCPRTGVSRIAGQIASQAYLDSPSRRLGLIEYSVVDRMQMIHGGCAGESIIRTPTGSAGTHGLWSRGIAAPAMSLPTRRCSAIGDPRPRSHAAMSFRRPPSHGGQPWRSAWGLR
jgi:hypothetical protein